VGATGIGEAITRSLLSFRVADRIIGGSRLKDAMQWALDEIVEDGAEVGIIAMGSDGEGLGLSNRTNMPWAGWIGR
jgi:isoaspartyl peptidase/L-asparaginase-like protein (Ntn-hydrolase superfamily)